MASKCYAAGRLTPPQPTVQHHPADYRLTAADREQVRRGKWLFVRARALAMAEFVCRRAGYSEIMWYWLARQDEPLVIDSLVLPDSQYASPGYCQIAGDEVLKLGRRVRGEGLIIVGAGHSHGRGSALFSSEVDERQMAQLAAEKVGFASRRQVRLVGEVARLTGGDGQDEDAGQAGRRRGTATVSVAVSLPHFVSLFSTHNAMGQWYFPLYHRMECPLCSSSRIWLSQEVIVHVMGDEVLDEATAESLAKQVDRSLRQYSSCYYYWQPGQYQGWQQDRCQGQLEQMGPAGRSVQGPAYADVQASEFQVWRYGELVGRVPAAVMEEAAFRVPALARALGWETEHQSVQTQTVEHRCGSDGAARRQADLPCRDEPDG